MYSVYTSATLNNTHRQPYIPRGSVSAIASDPEPRAIPRIVNEELSPRDRRPRSRLSVTSCISLSASNCAGGPEHGGNARRQGTAASTASQVPTRIAHSVQLLLWTWYRNNHLFTLPIPGIPCPILSLILQPHITISVPPHVFTAMTVVIYIAAYLIVIEVHSAHRTFVTFTLRRVKTNKYERSRSSCHAW